MLKKMDEVLTKVELPFILFWEFMLIIRMISTYSLIPSKVDSLIFALISLVGGIILLRNGLQWLQKKRQLSILLLLFTIALIISSILNGSSGLVANFKLIIWQALFFFVVYEIGKKNEGHLFRLVEKLLVFVWFLLIVISLGMFFVQFSYTAPLDKLYYGIRMGFVENRLYGVFVDPNYGATISVVALCFSFHLFQQAKNKLYKAFLIISMLFEFMYVVLSGSRTAFIEVMAIALAGTFFYLYYLQRNQSLVKRVTYSFIAGIIVVAGIYLAMNLTQKVSVASANAVEKIVVIKKDESKVSLERKDVGENADVSNSRFKLWRSAFEIFESTPLVGTAPKNMVPYAQEHLPKTWIAEKEQTPHNFVFYLLATTGLIGTIPFVLFIVFSMIKTLLHLFEIDIVEYKEYLYQSLIVLTILISACLITDVVLVNKLGSMLFFLYLGNLKSKNEQETSE
jgi:O-antigen ligase